MFLYTELFQEGLGFFCGVGEMVKMGLKVWGCLLQVSGGEDEIQQLQKALLDYLDENTETDASLVVCLVVRIPSV